MDPETSQEIWFVEAGGEVFETNFAEMTKWITDGSLLRIDRVRRGNLRWIEAGKVPSLTEFFEAQAASSASSFSTTSENAVPPPTMQSFAGAACSIHEDAPARYACDTCANSFCKACPSGYGANVKICPFCGSMCRTLDLPPANGGSTTTYRTVTDGTPFGPSDIAKAFAFPFKYPLSLVFGAVMFTFFTVGQSAAGIGGFFMLGAVLVCYMLSNMLTFGVFAHTIENFTQGKFDAGFMPSFDGFNLWDDVVHPFFLSLGAYISSFVPLFIVAILGIFMIGSTVIQDKINEPIRQQAADPPRQQPVFKFVDDAPEQSKKVRELVDGQANTQKRRVEQFESGSPIDGIRLDGNETEEEAINKITDIVVEHRKQQLESAVGKTDAQEEAEREVLAQKLVKRGGMFLVLFMLVFAFGCFYFPAACAVAGYTRSLGATLNPAVVFDTILTLGVSYVLILFVTVVLLVVGGLLSFVASTTLSAFDLPGLGNIPVKAVGSFVTFYLWIVWSAVIGYALARKADRFQFAR